MGRWLNRGRTVARNAVVAAIFAVGAAAQVLGEERIDPTPPERVSVLPVFFVPTDQRPPTSEQKTRLVKHRVRVPLP
jgi:hypothetical protein